MVVEDRVELGCWGFVGGVGDEEDEVGFGEGFAGAGDAEGFGFVERGSEAVRRPAVSTRRMGMPSRAKVSSMVSRVVPGVAVTMARSRVEEAVEEGALAGVGAADEGELDAVALERAGAEGGGERGEWGLDGGDGVADLGGGDGVDVVELAGGEVHAGFEQGDEVDELLLDGSDAAAECAAELLGGGAGLREGLRGDEVVDGFGLGEVEAAGEEGSAGELAGFGEADRRIYTC